ncbi:MAG: group II intron reverse transcriptase domain-containing protein [Bacteroidetes bacterium]|nr:group II intron reverse transcriptase domain-containing protein [Bacteroidota bacterium]
MQKVILKELEKEAVESLEKFQNYHNYLHLEYLRKKQRLTTVPEKEVKTPEEWNASKMHNPFYVLKHKHKIAASVARKIRNETYIPNQPFTKEIPKKSGGTRKISIFQLPDSAVSDKFYHDLLKKNRHRFSSFSYAYRNDRNVHFAIQDIANELRQSPRIFIAEFDFSKFFDSINHSYIREQLRENCFLISKTEAYIIEKFMETQPGGVGIALGTSISLFLANVACWQLDRKLENEGLRFARYADDTIIWTRDYGKICKAFEIIAEFSKATGIKINYDKSDGISLLQQPGMRSEFSQNKASIDFLGYQISTTKISIKENSVKKIKKQIAYLLYKDLLLPIKTRPVLASRFPTATRDKDFLSVVSEIRRYLYGNLTEKTLTKFLNGTYAFMNFKGIMSFYPLVNDEEQMKNLDKWMVSTILNTLKRRSVLLNDLGYPTSFFPFEQTPTSLIYTAKITANGHMQIPSFLRIYRALEKGIQNMGIDKVMNPQSKYYSEW